MRNLPILSASLLFALVACGGYPAPNDKLISTEAGIRTARRTGVPKDPQAALHLKYAEEQLEQAKRLVKKGSNKRAEYALMKANSDSKLAVALSKEKITQDQAKAAVKQARSDEQQ